MEDFIKQWGPAIITVLAFMILIGIVVAFKGQIGAAFNDLFNNFTDSVNLATTSAPPAPVTP